MPETLTGQIERVTFHNSDNGFAVLQVKLRGRQDLATVVGHLNDATAGEHLEATGQWVIDREHGPQFKAQDIRTAHPASAEGIERYLAAGAISGIGPKLAAKIVGIYNQRIRYAKKLSGHTSSKYIWHYTEPSREAQAQAIEDLF